jgi:hypothetical protein
MNDQKLPTVQVEKVLTMGDVRQLLMETAINIRDGAINNKDADSIVGCIDAMTRCMQVEINAAKMALNTEGKLHEFGKVVQLGKLLIKDSGLE